MNKKILQSSWILWAILAVGFASVAKAEMDLPFWVKVDYEAKHVYDKEKKQVKDDVVGFLVADGLAVKKLHWYKPLLGNQNILLFNAKTSYITRLVDDIVKKTPLTSPPWTVSMGEVTPEKITWKRLHYGPVGSPYKIDMYWCQSSSKQAQVVVFWGTEVKRFAPYLKKLMADKSESCKS